MERIFNNNHYFINKEGEIYRQNKKDKKFKLLKPRLEKGYYKVCLYIDKIPKFFSVHRLLGICFIPNPENKPCIDHIDRDRTNNKLSNLRWATYKENVLNRETKSKTNYFHIYKTDANTYKVIKTIEGTNKQLFTKRFKTLNEANSFIENYS
jgi:hypothetical protein